MIGSNMGEKYSRTHFVIFTIGVNIIFGPMHFLGLNGMPRRIPDYADGFANWNSLITIGTILTIISLLLFIYYVGRRLLNTDNELLYNADRR